MIKWIKITEQKPSDDEWVLCHIKSIKKSALSFTDYIVLNYYKGEWRTDEYGLFNDSCFQVTHFALINSPPESEQFLCMETKELSIHEKFPKDKP